VIQKRHDLPDSTEYVHLDQELLSHPNPRSSTVSSETNKETYERKNSLKPQGSSVLKVGLISAASALAGGLAAAWWYRKTLHKLQNPIATPVIPKSGDSTEDADGV
jgi:hypothetical protein